MGLLSLQEAWARSSPHPRGSTAAGVTFKGKLPNRPLTTPIPLHGKETGQEVKGYILITKASPPGQRKEFLTHEDRRGEFFSFRGQQNLEGKNLPGSIHK